MTSRPFFAALTVAVGVSLVLLLSGPRVVPAHAAGKPTPSSTADWNR